MLVINDTLNNNKTNAMLNCSW